MSEAGEIIRGHLVPREPDRDQPGVMKQILDKLWSNISELNPAKLGGIFLRGKAYEPAANAQKVMVEAVEIVQRSQREDRLAEAEIELKRAEARAKDAEASRTTAEAQKTSAEAAQARAVALNGALTAFEKARELGIELNLEMIQTLIGQPGESSIPVPDTKRTKGAPSKSSIAALETKKSSTPPTAGS